MEAYSAKGSGMYPLAFIVISAILLNAYCCAASAVLVKTNTTFPCDGRLDECLVEDDLELELDFLINPYVSRILDATPGSASGGAVHPNGPAIRCNNLPTHPDQYSKCIAESKKVGNHGCLPQSTYFRC